MDDAEGLAAWAALLADRSRAAMCLALLDNRAWTVGELARHAGVAMPTASEHADRLVNGGLAAEHRQGRHRYLSLAGPEVAALLESVSSQVAPGHAPLRSMAAAHRMRNLAAARTCYDHLAGTLGVAVADALAATGAIDRRSGLTLTGEGRALLGNVGIELATTTRRPLLRDCLDWTERRPHLGGVLGAAICRHAFDAGWIGRIGTGRAVRVTPAGADAFADQLGVVVPSTPDTPGAIYAARGAPRVINA
ncbi:winged helix-turn-helix transcriptional regulator [Actinoplanes sp. TBRC 11911]|uniref:ArsR/SmtB family transcription factor n=1 Tax=Actinoplanes sp. TBRC 11911 TaxID=2729386 RepID=UPI00145E9EC9|nr:winged helix-turn-helix domain-containing protein [Actinoplanes sp. TBRC 11911]NMO56270.1 winged helix-turn-helix transcriptional regulator [Actinoplanes sp. TBRC 11911]